MNESSSSDRICNLIVPKLTTINHDMYEIGRVAADNLIARLESVV